jgi:co-chaperonin GroES (HSP10)
MVLTHQEVAKIRPLNNHVLVKLNRKSDELILQGGGKIYIDNTFEEEKHVPVTGTVVAYPHKLYYNNKPGIGHSMPWDTDIEIQQGDYVIFYYMAVVNCLGTIDKPGGNGKYFKDEDGGEYIMITYNNLFVARRDQRIIPLNGYLIVEPIEDEAFLREKERFEKAKMILPRNYTRLFAKEGIVRFLGTPLREYRDRDKRGDLRFTDEGMDIHHGQRIMIQKSADLPLEYDTHASLKGRKKFLRVQRRYILYATD